MDDALNRNDFLTALRRQRMGDRTREAGNRLFIDAAHAAWPSGRAFAKQASGLPDRIRYPIGRIRVVSCDVAKDIEIVAPGPAERTTRVIPRRPSCASHRR